MCQVPISVKYVTNSISLVDTTIKHRIIEHLNIVLIIYQTTRSNISEDFNLEQYRSETANHAFRIAVMFVTFDTIVATSNKYFRHYSHLPQCQLCHE